MDTVEQVTLEEVGEGDGDEVEEQLQITYRNETKMELSLLNALNKSGYRTKLMRSWVLLAFRKALFEKDGSLICTR